MTHFKEFFDSQFIGVWSLDGKDVVATIKRVEKGSVGGQQGKKKDSKAIIHFAEFDEPMACNVTNAKTIAAIYGPDVREWPGKRVTLYPTTTTFGRDTVECIRIRPVAPKNGSSGKQASREPGAERAAQNAAAGRGDSPVPPEAQAMMDAKTADELHAAIYHGARWIDANSKTRWPRVVAHCERVGLDVEIAERAAADGMDA